jgi:hypothetical protein
MTLVKTLANLKLANRLNEVLKGDSDEPLYVRDSSLFYPLCKDTPGFYRGTRVVFSQMVPTDTFTYGNTNYRIPQDILEALRDEEFSEATQAALETVKPMLISSTEAQQVSTAHEVEQGQPQGPGYEDEVIPFPEEPPAPKPYDGPIIEERIAFEDIPVVKTRHWVPADATTAEATQAFLLSEEATDSPMSLDGADGFMEELEASRTMEPDQFEAFMEEKFPLRPREKTWEYDEIIGDMAEAMEGTEYVEDQNFQVPTMFGQPEVPSWEDIEALEAELLDLKDILPAPTVVDYPPTTAAGLLEAIMRPEADPGMVLKTAPTVVDVAPEDPQGYVPSFNHMAPYTNTAETGVEDQCGSCVRPGTRVKLLDGSTKDIQDLLPGDEVLSFEAGEDEEDETGEQTWIEHLADQADINEWIIGNVIPDGIEIKTADDLTILDCFRVTAAFALKRV